MRNDETDHTCDVGENKVQSSELEDEEAAKSTISDDEGEYKCDINGEEYQSSALADEGSVISYDEECCVLPQDDDVNPPEENSFQRNKNRFSILKRHVESLSSDGDKFAEQNEQWQERLLELTMNFYVLEEEMEKKIDGGIDEERFGSLEKEVEELMACAVKKSGDLNDDVDQSNGHEGDETTGDDEECVGDELKDEEYQSTASSIGTTNDEEYQSSEFGVEGKKNKYGRWKLGVLVFVFGLILVAVVAGIGSNNNRAVRGGETASVTVLPQDNEDESMIENETEIESASENMDDVEAPLPSVCLPKESFEIAMADAVEEYSCNTDVYCHTVPANNACNGNTGTICEGACNSPAACLDNKGDVQSCSCLGNDACHENEGDLGLFACNAKNACKKNKGTIGMLSCNKNRACFDNVGDVEFESCDGNKACLHNHGSISFKSCNSFKACNENRGPVGEQACNGRESCLHNSGTIGPKSCNGEKSCCGNTRDIGHGECNADFECCNADVSHCECPASQTNITSAEETPANVVSNSSEVLSSTESVGIDSNSTGQ